MRLEHDTIEPLKKALLDIVRNYLDLSQYQVFFFGSRISGGGDERSDIDVGIEGPEPIADDTMAHIRNDIEHLPFLYKIDIVDFKNVSKEFYTEAKHAIEVIN